MSGLLGNWLFREWFSVFSAEFGFKVKLSAITEVIGR